MNSVDYSQTSSALVNGVEASVTFEYAVAEPYAVTMLIGDAPWVFSRDLILDATQDKWLGEGDVRTGRDPGVLHIVVHAEGLVGWVTVPLSLVQQFVSAICRLVRPGNERMDIDWEKELLS